METRAHLTQKQKAEVMLRQDGKCALPSCRKRLIPGLFQFDHTQALEHDGDNELDNWRALCTKPCHQDKTKQDNQGRAKRDRIAVGGRQRKGPPVPGSRASGLKKHMDGSVSRR